MPSHLLAEHIGLEKLTQGSEPSQYLEEEKATAIPSVAASESGTAQTAGVFPCGVVGPFTWELQSGLLAEWFGKSNHRG